MELTFDQYQALAKTTAIYPKDQGLAYPVLGLVGEAGEVAEKLKKSIRDNTPIDRDLFVKELGDVLWYISAIAGDIGATLNQVAETNYLKLKDRAERKVIQGSGDNR